MRLLRLSFVCVLAAFVLAAVALLPSRLCFKGADSYTFFTGNTSKDCKEVVAEKNADELKLSLSDISGECATYSSLDLDTLLNSVNGEVVFKEEVCGSVNYYCKADLPYSVNLYGEQINLHVCFKEDGSVKVASPIIFGGY